MTLTINITTALQDNFENTLSSGFTQDFTFTGTDLMIYDRSVPEVELIKLITNELFIEFNEEIATGSISGSIELTTGTNTIEGTITAVDSKTIKYTLNDNLTNTTTYTIKVKSPLSDLSGKTISDFIQEFAYMGSDLLLYEKASESEHQESIVKNSYLFQGRSYDPISGLYYYRARYYHPELGRFIQADPMGYEDSMNTYQAFNQNPVNYTDPMGKQNIRIEFDDGTYLDTGTGWGKYKGSNDFDTNKIDLSNYFENETKIGSRIVSTLNGYSLVLSPQEAYDIAQMANIGLEFVPVIGTIKGIFEAIAGYDLAGNKMAWLERILQIPGVTDVIVGSYKLIVKSSKHMDVVLPLDSINFKGEVFRYNKFNHMDTAWDIHKGNIKASHRFSGPGKGALYSSLDAWTAFKETRSDLGRWLTVRRAKVKGIIDLTDPKIRQKFNVTLEDIASMDFYDITQPLGDLIKSKGYKGILAPSAQNPGGVNLILFKGIE